MAAVVAFWRRGLRTSIAREAPGEIHLNAILVVTFSLSRKLYFILFLYEPTPLFILPKASRWRVLRSSNGYLFAVNLKCRQIEGQAKIKLKLKFGSDSRTIETTGKTALKLASSLK